MNIKILTSIKPMEAAILNIKLTSCKFLKPIKSPISMQTVQTFFFFKKIDYFQQRNQQKCKSSQNEEQEGIIIIKIILFMHI